MNAIVRYCLALAALRFGFDLHAFVFLSNHFHIVATDRFGQLPLFMHHLDLLLARALNARHGHAENFWAPGTYSAVELTDTDSVFEKIAYTLANPVSAGLVSSSALWPGVISRVRDIGGPCQWVSRPREFFRSEGPNALPEQVPLVLMPPLGCDDLSMLHRQLEARLADHEERARQARHGRPFLGRRRILAQRVFARPEARDPQFGLNPRVAGRDKWKRIEALRRLRSFLDTYHRAWLSFKAGLPDLLFPAGTWQLRREFGLPCAAPP